MSDRFYRTTGFHGEPIIVRPIDGNPLTPDEVERARREAMLARPIILPQGAQYAPRRLSPNAVKVLRYLRDRTGDWTTMPVLRQAALGVDPIGFGEPYGHQALREIDDHGIHIEMSVAWVCYGRDGGVWINDPEDLGTPAEVTETIGGGGWSRENVWRLP